MKTKNFNIEWFDVEGYLNNMGVPFYNQGKNIQSGWIGIACPWCDDHSNHLGIDLNTKGINCFRCPARGTVISLVMKLERIDFPTAIQRIKSFTHRDLSSIEESSGFGPSPNSLQQVQLPSHSQKLFERYHEEYLADRNFDPLFLTQKYKLQFTGPLGNYRMRIVVPIYSHHQLVSFTTRDVTGEAKIPWVHGSPEFVIYSPKDCLYNIDTVKDTALIVEGASDVWRMGDGAVATFGHKYTKRQVFLLRNVKRAFILFDTEEEAQEDANRLAHDLSTVIPDVNVFELDQGDPGSLSPEDAMDIRLEIFGKKFY